VHRRDLLKRVAALGLVAATPEPVRRFWALGEIPQGSGNGLFVDTHDEWAPPWELSGDDNIVRFLSPNLYGVLSYDSRTGIIRVEDWTF